MKRKFSRFLSKLLSKLEAPREPVSAMNVSPAELDSILYG